MARKKTKNNSESGGGGAPAWMTTYGDLMTLLLCFFVLIVSFSSVEMVKFQKALGSLKGSLGVLTREQSVMKQWDPIIPQLTDFQQKRVQKVISELRNMVKLKGMQKNLTFEATDDGVIVRIDSPILYNSGSAQLKSAAFPILDKILEMTMDWSNTIRIEGHTDNKPIHNSKYLSNWELSTDRALSVLRYFLNTGKVEPQRLAAVGYGEYHPLVPNISEANCAKNRRVEIYIKGNRNIENFHESGF